MINIEPIGYIRNSRIEPTDDFWGGIKSTIELIESIDKSALDGIETFSHLEIIFHFHLALKEKISYTSRHPRNNPDWPKVGIFAQRGKNRPNQLGLTIVRLIEKKSDGSLLVENLDAIDGTPVIDIKPVTRNFLPDSEIVQPFWVDELSKNYWKKK